MTPRRAKVRRRHIVVPVAVAATLVAGGVIAATQWGQAPVSSPVPSVAAATSAPAGSPTPTTVESSPSQTPKPTSPPSSAKVNPAAARALKSCQHQVQAADAVMAAAKTGVNHWASHVRAQTDQTKGKISVGNMKGKFKKTRLAGPKDQRRYASALADYDQAKASCDKVQDASPAVARRLSQCRTRSKAQQPVMAAGARGMADWKNHLADMARSSSEYVPAAEQIWLQAWRAAPKNIDAYRRAVDRFDAPSC